MGKTEKDIKKLDEIYEQSLEEHKKQEKAIQDRVKTELVKLDEILNKLKIAQDDIEKIRQKNVELTAENTKLTKIKIDFEVQKKLVEEGFKKERENIVIDREKVKVEERESNKRIVAEEDELKQIKITNDAILAKNEGVLANIKSEQESLNKIRLDIGKSGADLKLAQDNFSGYVSKLNDDRRSFEAQQIVQERERKKIEEDKVAVVNRENTVITRENLVAEREQKVEDREVDADLRDVSLDKKEQRVKDLQTIYDARKK